MTNVTPSAQLERKIEKFFDAYSAKCLAKATFVVGLSSIGAAFIAYFLSLNAFIAAGAFLLFGLIMVNVAIFAFVPPTRQLTESRALLINAVNRPSLISNVDKKNVVISNKSGEKRLLNSYEQKAWDSIIMPFFFRATASSEKLFKQSSLVRSKKEELEALEARHLMREVEEKQLLELKAQIEAERTELERRNSEISTAEEMVISRLTAVETAEVQIAQLRDDLNADTQRASAKPDDTALKDKESKLQAKESEVEALKLRLLEDRRIVEQQKTELNQMKGDMLRDADLDIDSPNSENKPEDMSLEDSLKARENQLETMARELEERSRYVDSVEESLVERLGQLTEREAYLEQGEINQGIRSD
jgi:DNA repair exonuclease SbcCD ATPase subunit